MQEGEGQKKWSTMKSTFFASSTTPSSSIQASMESKPRPPLEEVFEMEILLLFFFLLLLGEAEKNGNLHSKPSDNFGEMGAWGPFPSSKGPTIQLARHISAPKPI